MGYGGETTYCNFGYETVFKTPVTANKAFGLDVKLRRVSARNNIRRIYQLASRNAQKLLESQFEGALEIEFYLGSPWFLKAVLGANSVTGSGPYVHTFSETNEAPSMTVEQGYDQATDQLRKYLGVIVNQCRISMSVGDEPARVTLSCLYASESIVATAIGTQVAEAEEAFPFDMGDFQVPDSTTIADTDSVEITITNTAALRWALGSRIASRFRMGERLYDIDTTNYFDDPTTYLTALYGDVSSPYGPSNSVAEIATATLVFDNGLSTTDQRLYEFKYTGVKPEEHDLPASLEDDLMERVTLFARSLSIDVTNNTATMP